MAEIEAVYEGGVFRPLEEVHLREKQRVRLRVEPIDGTDALAWLEEVREFQKRVVEQHGVFPDSTPDIAADRLR
jgi:predicted DNA-binding antitoxin AbrB/MazE fold protein